MKKFIMTYENYQGKTVALAESDDWDIAEAYVVQEIEKGFTKMRIYQAVSEYTADVTINQKDL